MVDTASILIKPYEQQYQQQVIDLILFIQQKEFFIPITIDDQPDLFMIDTFYQANNGNFWVALSEDKVVGTIALLDCGKKLGALRKMFVHKDFRGKEKGTAQLLLTNLFNWAKEKGFDEVILGTAAILVAAQKFYLRNGFTLTDKNLLPDHFPIMKVDTLFFVKKL